MREYFKLRYIFLFYALVRVPLHVYILKFDDKGRVFTLLLILTLIYHFRDLKFRKGTKNPALIYWTLWVIYATINTFVQGMNFEMHGWQFVVFLFVPLFIMFVVDMKDYTDRHKVLNVVVVAMYLRIILTFLFDTESTIAEGRLGYLLNANEIGISATLLLFVLYLKYIHREVKLMTLLVLAVAPVAMLMLTSSRTAVVGAFLIFVGNFIIVRSKNYFRTAIILLTGIISVYVLVNYATQKTVVGRRLAETRQEGKEVANTGTIFDNLGGRAVYFIYGFELYKKHPIYGVGLGNYRDYNPESEQPNHVEYMVQFSELGTIGVVLFFLFYFYIIKYLIYCWKQAPHRRRYTETYLLGIIVILAMNLGAWTYSNPIVFVINGLAIAYIAETNRIIREQRWRG